jgi:enediyne biosynthesis protein E4
LLFILINQVLTLHKSEAFGDEIPKFKDVKDEVGLYSPGVLGQAAVWGDYNIDGWQDILISGMSMRGSPRMANKLRKRTGGAADGSGSYRSLLLFKSSKGKSFKVEAGKTGLPDITARAAAWADYNNDGYIDLAVVTIESGNSLKLFKNSKGTSFVDITERAGLTKPTTNSRQVIWVDYDKDGFVDLFQTGASASYLYRNKGDGTFEEVSDKAGLRRNEKTNGAVWFDSNNDGYPDLFLANNGLNSFYINNRNGTFTDATKVSGIAGEASWRTTSACVGDFNGDGYLDLYITNIGKAGRNALFRNNKDGTFTDVTAETNTGGDAADGRTCAWVDFDADGKLDLFTTNHVRPSKLFRNTGKGVFKDVALQAGIDLPRDVFAATWADYDRDGFIDVFLNGHIGSALMRNGGNSNNSITLRLAGDGKKSNSSAIGARVKVSGPDGVQVREVSGGRGCCEQDMLPLYFGLGGNKAADIDVTWPSGKACSFKGVSVIKSREYKISEIKCEISPSLK